MMILKRNRLFTAITLAAALAMTACTQDELAENTDTLPEGMYPLEIASVTLAVESSEQPWTRVSESEDGNSSEWQTGDAITVSLNGETATYTYNGSAWTSTAPLYWKDTRTAAVNAWYASPDTDGTIDLSDQSEGLAYVLQGSGSGSYESAVSLTFSNQLAKVRVMLDRSEQVSEEDVEQVAIYSYTTCTHSQGTITSSASEAGWITMHKVDGQSYYEANVVPGYTIAKFKINDTESDLTQTVTPAAGEMNTITISVSNYYYDTFYSCFFNSSGGTRGSNFYASSATVTKLVTEIMGGQMPSIGSNSRTFTTRWGESITITDEWWSGFYYSIKYNNYTFYIYTEPQYAILYPTITL